MNCLGFERLLDDGAPRHLPAAAHAHARECVRCERSLARSRSLELALERHFASRDAADASAVPDGIPNGFADRVLARVERGEARGVRWLALPDALPWWVRATAEPSVLLASAVAALVLWRGDALVEAARAWFPLAASAPSRWAEFARGWGLDALGRSFAQALVPAPDAHWLVATGVVLAVMPLFVLLAFVLWRAGERFAGVMAAPGPR